MKRIILKIFVTGTVLVLMCGVSLANVSYSSYKVDHSSIDAIIDNAVEISLLNAAFDFNSSTALLSASPEPWVAFALCWVVGWCGIHRHYLGSKDTMWALYFFTCGGVFGIVTFVDWVVLLVGAINEDVSKYVDNPKFIMW